MAAAKLAPPAGNALSARCHGAHTPSGSESGTRPRPWRSSSMRRRAARSPGVEPPPSRGRESARSRRARATRRRPERARSGRGTRPGRAARPARTGPRPPGAAARARPDSGLAPSRSPRRRGGRSTQTTSGSRPPAARAAAPRRRPSRSRRSDSARPRGQGTGAIRGRRRAVERQPSQLPRPAGV